MGADSHNFSGAPNAADHASLRRLCCVSTTFAVLEKPEVVIDQVIELDIQLTFKDCLRAAYWYSWRRRTITLPFLILCLILLIAFSVSVTLMFPRSAIWLFIPWVCQLFTAASPYLWVRGATRANNDILAPKHWTFSSDGISMLGSGSSNSTGWEKIRHAYESKHNILLERSPLRFFTIPKRYFLNEGQLQDFKDLLRISLSESAKRGL